jgi:hypothetical protein
VEMLLLEGTKGVLQGEVIRVCKGETGF